MQLTKKEADNHGGLGGIRFEFSDDEDTWDQLRKLMKNMADSESGHGDKIRRVDVHFEKRRGEEISTIEVFACFVYLTKIISLSELCSSSRSLIW